ncbi:cob(I)yrinic acid a,c-diamide adenosyltransferase [Lacticaseibacillus zeae]|uniref:Corrinoid adenosyltransferase n=1 Tax=Lacticaseibacillus zeae TaxID=57037 RepID=A0A5R8LX92_LACZE|nr:cob(I)yrinic acid a,c-diamide adenosyltransferase [Lacticaseibacillus zeae]TLF41916.1 cob(I)yrinic acid a,c-diamide adenosyltransferase [Lacticaseibacillus zeae]
MKLYTKVGDHGATKQINGKKVPKYDPQIIALGDLDELDSWLGYVASQATATPGFDWLAQVLEDRQRELYELLADVAVPRHHTITEAHVKALEDAIDDMMAQVPRITAFVLPGGHPLAAALQYGRAVARRAERSLDLLAEEDKTVTAVVLQYSNRLSDYLFALARYVNFKAGVPEVKSKKAHKG